MKIIITGGAGFIGSAAVRHFLSKGFDVLTLDCLTYAGNKESLEDVLNHSRHRFVQRDIVQTTSVVDLLTDFGPDGIIHLAAETHVDRSIEGPRAFIHSNIEGTYSLLSAALDYWQKLKGARQEKFRFHHVSTDEVFGSLAPGEFFSESSKYDPRSPYSASKAASDHLVRAWHYTYGLPTIISNCSNNYGPRQFPEKVIPRAILNALEGKPIEVYGDGRNIRDWIHVDDHVRALSRIFLDGIPGDSYTVGGGNELSNNDLLAQLCRIMDELLPDSKNRPHSTLLAFVPDRPGHDFRYAVDSTKVKGELGWRPEISFEAGLRDTVQWYISHPEWCRLMDKKYGGKRLGRLGETA